MGLVTSARSNALLPLTLRIKDKALCEASKPSGTASDFRDTAAEIALRGKNTALQMGGVDTEICRFGIHPYASG